MTRFEKINKRKHYRYIQTADMTEIERQSWTDKYNCFAKESTDGGIIEIQPIQRCILDENQRPIENTKESVLMFSVCDENYRNEIGIFLSSRNDIRELRDYLNRYLEK